VDTGQSEDRTQLIGERTRRSWDGDRTRDKQSYLDGHLVGQIRPLLLWQSLWVYAALYVVRITRLLGPIVGWMDIGLDKV